MVSPNSSDNKGTASTSKNNGDKPVMYGGTEVSKLINDLDILIQTESDEQKKSDYRQQKNFLSGIKPEAGNNVTVTPQKSDDKTADVEKSELTTKDKDGNSKTMERFDIKRDGLPSLAIINTDPDKYNINIKNQNEFTKTNKENGSSVNVIDGKETLAIKFSPDAKDIGISQRKGEDKQVFSLKYDEHGNFKGTVDPKLVEERYGKNADFTIHDGKGNLLKFNNKTGRFVDQNGKVSEDIKAVDKDGKEIKQQKDVTPPSPEEVKRQITGKDLSGPDEKTGERQTSALQTVSMAANPGLRAASIVPKSESVETTLKEQAEKTQTQSSPTAPTRPTTPTQSGMQVGG